MTDILNLNLNDFRKQFIKLSEEEQEKIILNDNFINCDENKVIFAFNTTSNNNKNNFVINSKLLLKLLKSVLTKPSKINIIEPNYQKLIICNINPFLELNDDELFSLIKSMKIDIYKSFIKRLNNYIYDNDIDTDNYKINKIKEFYQTKNFDFVYQYLNQKINIKDEKLIKQLALNFYNRNRNIFELYRIETKEQAFIYNRFGIIVNKELFEISYENNNEYEKYNISLDLLNTLNSKHVIKIMNELKRKGDISDTKLFILAVKMYTLFGLDNALKVINDKFTYSTSSSLQKAAIFQFTYNERIYRLSHSDEFLNYELIEKLRKSIQSNNMNVLKKILVNKDDTYVVNLFNELRENYSLYKNDKKMLSYLNQTIKQEIDIRQREKLLKYMAEFYEKNNSKREKVTSNELFKLFAEFDTLYVNFDYNFNVVMDTKLKNFLLGNEKSDNDSLLRMVLNKQALDYDNELINIINNYKKIEETKKELKLDNNYSLLDTLDIYKTFRYNLAPDELDIPLSVISKTALSKEHLNVSEEESINNFKYVYKEQKKKYSSTIPRVKGITKNNYKYKVLDKNDPEILTCGIDTGNCFKPGGPGWPFYKYCLTSIYGDVIGIKDPDNKLYICPIIRNGNGIYGNGIDPENIDKDKLPYIIEALKKCYSEIIKKSSSFEKIEFCTLTDLHEYISEDDHYPSINIEKPPMIGESFYCDITKNNIKNYVIVGNGERIKEYIPSLEYEIPRNKIYVYSPDQVENKLLIEQKINEIKYRSIENSPYSEEDKKRFKENYRIINVDNYSYIVCNDDWYIAISDYYGLESAFLPYDPRAKDEFYLELEKIRKNNKISMNLNENTIKRK